MKLETNKTEGKCTKRIGFITRAHAKAASQDIHSKTLTNCVTNAIEVRADRMIEVKKK